MYPHLADFMVHVGKYVNIPYMDPMDIEVWHVFSLGLTFSLVELFILATTLAQQTLQILKP